MCEGTYGGIFRGGVLPRHEELRDFPTNISNHSAPLPSWVGYYPEYGSSCSSFVIMWAGAHMLLFWQHDAIIIRVIGAAVASNGVGAFMYHSTGSRAWGVIDMDTMIFAAWTIAIMCIEAMLEQIWRRKQMHRATGTALARLRVFFIACCWLTATLLFAWLAADAPGLGAAPRGDAGSWQPKPRIFDQMFLLPVLIALLVGIIIDIWERCHPQCATCTSGSAEVWRICRRRFYVGVGCLTFAFAQNHIGDSACNPIDKWGQLYPFRTYRPRPEAVTALHPHARAATAPHVLTRRPRIPQILFGMSGCRLAS